MSILKPHRSHWFLPMKISQPIRWRGWRTSTSAPRSDGCASTWSSIRQSWASAGRRSCCLRSLGFRTGRGGMCGSRGSAVGANDWSIWIYMMWVMRVAYFRFLFECFFCEVAKSEMQLPNSVWIFGWFGDQRNSVTFVLPSTRLLRVGLYH